MYGIVGVHASEFTNVRSLGERGTDTRLKPDYQHAHSCLEVTAPETTASSRSATLTTPEPWEKIGHNRVS